MSVCDTKIVRCIIFFIRLWQYEREYDLRVIEYHIQT